MRPDNGGICTLMNTFIQSKGSNYKTAKMAKNLKHGLK